MLQRLFDRSQCAVPSFWEPRQRAGQRRRRFTVTAPAPRDFMWRRVMGACLTDTDTAMSARAGAVVGMVAAGATLAGDMLAGAAGASTALADAAAALAGMAVADMAVADMAAAIAKT